ncbi:IS66 family insertion sequence element accessory protein TnpA [Candidatus Accumulibacter meliphilus]
MLERLGASAETQRAYCDRHGLKNHSLSYWHLRLVLM